MAMNSYGAGAWPVSCLPLPPLPDPDLIAAALGCPASLKLPPALVRALFPSPHLMELSRTVASMTCGPAFSALRASPVVSRRLDVERAAPTSGEPAMAATPALVQTPPAGSPAEVKAQAVGAAQGRAKRRRMSPEEADREARGLARQFGDAFYLFSERKKAKLIGCHVETWHKTEFYPQAEKRKARLLRRAGQGIAGAPSAVSLTERLQATIAVGNPDEVMRRLAADEELRRVTIEQLDEQARDSRSRGIGRRERL
jgi:hypothetical protein